MAQKFSQNTPRDGGMDKDLDDRLLNSGKYRDGLNINVGRSEGPNIGVVQNVRGNELIPGQDNISGTTIGSVSDPNSNKLYWFTADNNKDGIYEYDLDTGSVLPILLDNRDATLSAFTFANASVECFVSQSGAITLSATLVDSTTLLTVALSAGQDANLGTVNTPTTRTINVDVTAPNMGFSNPGAVVSGTCTAVQLATPPPPNLTVSISTTGDARVGTLLLANPSGGTPRNTPPNYNFAWRLQGQTDVLNTNQSFRPTAAGTYEVTVTDFGDPAQTATATSEITAALSLDIFITGEGQLGSTLGYE